MFHASVRRFVLGTDALLRGDGALRDRFASPTTMGSLRHLLITTLIFGMFYGAVMGAFGGFGSDRLLQVLYSAIKVPMLLLVSFCLSLPSFFVLNTLLGVRSDFPRVIGSVMSTQAGLTVVLASLAPFTAFWYVSDSRYDAALTFNAAMFGVATLAANWILRRAYRPLIRRNPRHRLLLIVWLVTYAFVTIQMAWVLRPFVGDPSSPVSFFRRDAWGNAYVELFRIVKRAMGI